MGRQHGNGAIALLWRCQGGGAKMVVPGWRDCRAGFIPALGADLPCVTGRKNPLRRGTAAPAPGHQRGGKVTNSRSLLPTTPFSRSPGPCRRCCGSGAGQRPELLPFIPAAGTFCLSNTLLPFAFPSGSAADNSLPALFTGAKSTPVHTRRRGRTQRVPAAGRALPSVSGSGR